MDKRLSNCGSHFRETEASNAIVWRATDHVENYDTGWTKTLIQSSLQTHPPVTHNSIRELLRVETKLKCHP